MLQMAEECLRVLVGVSELVCIGSHSCVVQSFRWLRRACVCLRD